LVRKQIGDKRQLTNNKVQITIKDKKKLLLPLRSLSSSVFIGESGGCEADGVVVVAVYCYLLFVLCSLPLSDI